MTRTRIAQPPVGTYGLTVEPWSRGEVYGVAANWSQASAPVYTYDEDGGWTPSGRQVADYRHEAREALAEVIRRTLVESGETDPDDDEIDGIVDDADKVDATESVAHLIRPGTVAVYWPEGESPRTGRVELYEAQTHVTAGDRLSGESALLLALRNADEDDGPPEGWRLLGSGTDADGDWCDVYERAEG